MMTERVSIRINDGIVTRDGHPYLHLSPPDAMAEMYRAIGVQYPKFFKMDALCKWGWLGAEALLRVGNGMLYDGLDKSRISVVIATRNGCIDTDLRYAETMKEIPSPAVFVYTLPNIMHGEICIRHGFGGEQLCLVQERYDAEEINFWCHDIIRRGNTDACLAGWVDIKDGLADIALEWIRT